MEVYLQTQISLVGIIELQKKAFLFKILCSLFLRGGFPSKLQEYR